MTMERGGERETLAPVIPLFGAAQPAAPNTNTPAADTSTERMPQPDSDRWHATWIERGQSTSDARASTHPVFARRGLDAVPDDAPDDEVLAADAERDLLRKLRTRSLSLREARAALGARDLDPATIEEIVARFESMGYLDDAALAEQLIDKATSRKAQGRQAIAQTLSQRGIPRDVIDIALDAQPDDDAARALEFARGKARSLAGLEHDVALRRLVGQLARRGYGAVALSTARQALEETAKPRHGVRFE
ncbi:regulatory protein RecX [Microbacterium dauci]|uniref:Regulatory protein RecX n=1 Tax=Microbacterium dauci TaxID=3048008 RepID=A0ABT6ZFT7_9MICO|nr:regulatory protein RecX [Microbacterium sp. LX3-4]MDJ1115032.1 regulatory protein RecX [Microbacterium sp. LX3-4]